MDSTALGVLVLPTCTAVLMGLVAGLLIRRAMEGLDALIARRHASGWEDWASDGPAGSGWAAGRSDTVSGLKGAGCLR